MDVSDEYGFDGFDFGLESSDLRTQLDVPLNVVCVVSHLSPANSIMQGGGASVSYQELGMHKFGPRFLN